MLGASVPSTDALYTAPLTMTVVAGGLDDPSLLGHHRAESDLLELHPSRAMYQQCEERVMANFAS
jgi:hypothetical protein